MMRALRKSRFSQKCSRSHNITIRSFRFHCSLWQNRLFSSPDTKPHVWILVWVRLLVLWDAQHIGDVLCICCARLDTLQDNFTSWRSYHITEVRIPMLYTCTLTQVLLAQNDVSMCTCKSLAVWIYSLHTSLPTQLRQHGEGMVEMNLPKLFQFVNIVALTNSKLQGTATTSLYSSDHSNTTLKYIGG